MRIEVRPAMLTRNIDRTDEPPEPGGVFSKAGGRFNSRGTIAAQALKPSV
jgi:hypothetical protein